MSDNGNAPKELTIRVLFFGILLAVILSAVVVGAVIGAFQMKGASPWRIASVGAPVAAVTIGIDGASGVEFQRSAGRYVHP